MQLEENQNQNENRIQTLQEEFIEKLKGLTAQQAKFVLEPVIDYVERNSIVQ